MSSHLSSLNHRLILNICKSAKVNILAELNEQIWCPISEQEEKVNIENSPINISNNSGWLTENEMQNSI